MKISIITVVKNNKKTIRDAIDSVLKQTYKNIEYIVVDGRSTDGTVDVVKNYGKKIHKFISKEDKGIYDAMNKGIRLATGDVIGFLNSDDFYFDKYVLETVANEFMTKEIDCLYGDLVYVDKNDVSKVVRYWKAKEFREGLLKTGWYPPHPTFFAKRECYERYGGFNLDFKIAADYELILRFLEKYKLKSAYINKVFVCMRVGGTSNRSLLNILKANIECYKAWKVNGLHVSPLLILLKPLSKIPQFFRKV